MVIVLIIVTAATVLIAIALILRNRRAEFSPNEESGGMELKGTSPVVEEVVNDHERNLYEIVEVDHMYDVPVLDTHNQDYEEIQVPSPNPEVLQLHPLSSTGDFELTQCPAYVAVATTNIHGMQY